MSMSCDYVCEGLSHVWLCVWRVTHMDESWHTREQVMSHAWTSHGTHMQENIYMPVRQKSVTHMDQSWNIMNKSYHTYKWVMSHTRTSHDTHIQGPKKKTATSLVTHTNESCHTHERVMSHTSHTWTSHITHTNESHIHEWVMTHTFRETST